MLNTVNLRVRKSSKQSILQAPVELSFIPAGMTIEDFVAQLNESASFRQFVYLPDDQDQPSAVLVPVDIDRPTPVVYHEPETYAFEDEAPVESVYSADLYLAPTGPLVERPDFVVPNSYDDRAIAERHGLERYVVENAINDGVLIR